MSVIAHLFYDETSARAYRQEAEAIVSGVEGYAVQQVGTKSYQNAVIAVVRSLTLYDLSHEPSTAPVVSNHPVKRCQPRERYQLAVREAREFLHKESGEKDALHIEGTTSQG